MTRWASAFLSGCLLVPLCACETAPTSAGPSVVDSLGVRIIDHGTLDVSGLPQWRLEPDPGVAEGADVRGLFGVTDAYRMSDGSIAIVDRSAMLRVFDHLGVYLWSVGGEGDGPGEFKYPQMVTEMAGDSLVVWDPVHSRLTVFSSDGVLARTKSVPELLGWSPSLGWFAPRQLLMQRATSERTSVMGRRAITEHGEPTVLDLGDGGTTVLGREFVVTQFEDSDGAFGPATFAVPAVFAAAPGGFWYGSTEDDEIRRATASGPDLILRWTGPDRATSEADFRALLRHWIDGPEATPERERDIRAYATSIPVAEHFPAYEMLRTDAVDRLWVRDYVREFADDGTRSWTVFSPDGAEIVGRLTHSASFRPLRIGADWVLGVDTDALGLERVSLRAIVRSSDVGQGVRNSVRD